MKLMQLLPVGKFDGGLLRDLAPWIADAFQVPVEVLPARLNPEFAFHGERQQYHSSEILAKMQSYVSPESWRVLGVTALDLYIPILTFVFGRHKWEAPARSSPRTVCNRNFMDWIPTGTC